MRAGNRNQACKTEDLASSKHGKHQPPTTKLQKKTNHQAPIESVLWFGTWSLELFWCLELGVWRFQSFDFSKSPKWQRMYPTLHCGSRFNPGRPALVPRYPGGRGHRCVAHSTAGFAGGEELWR